MNASKISAVPLQHANLCMDCEAITAAPTNCLACGSRALLSIARVLNQRALAEPAQREVPAILQITVPSVRQRVVSWKERSMGRSLRCRRTRLANGEFMPAEASREEWIV